MFKKEPPKPKRKSKTFEPEDLDKTDQVKSKVKKKSIDGAEKKPPRQRKGSKKKTEETPEPATQLPDILNTDEPSTITPFKNPMKISEPMIIDDTILMPETTPLTTNKPLEEKESSICYSPIVTQKPSYPTRTPEKQDDEMIVSFSPLIEKKSPQTLVANARLLFDDDDEEMSNDTSVSNGAVLVEESPIVTKPFPFKITVRTLIIYLSSSKNY